MLKLAESMLYQPISHRLSSQRKINVICRKDTTLSYLYHLSEREQTGIIYTNLQFKTRTKVHEQRTTSLKQPIPS